MSQIRQGSDTLRHVVTEEKKASTDTRGNLLDQIRTGVALKKVDPEAATNRNGDEAAAMALTGIAGMLQKALHERSTAICLSSSEDEVEDDEDEWDD